MEFWVVSRKDDFLFEVFQTDSLPNFEVQNRVCEWIAERTGEWPVKAKL